MEKLNYKEIKGFGFKERKKFEDLLKMESGFVLGFSDRTFQEFISDAVGVDIEKYNYRSNSKANRLRKYWAIEEKHNIYRLLEKLLEHYYDNVKKAEISDIKYNKDLYEDCRKIVQNLKSENPGDDLANLIPKESEKDYSILINDIIANIDKKQPEVAIDRLHTLTIKFVREFCDNNQIQYDKIEPLNSLFGKYVKSKKDIIESEMTIKILKSSISILDAFNKVRNEQSLAHDNPLLNYDEAFFICKSISNLFVFLKKIETPKI